jgi:hypothetical protein
MPFYNIKPKIMNKTKKLSRAEMKKVLGGSLDDCKNECTEYPPCPAPKTCKSVTCPSDPNFQHIVCQ